MSRPDMREKIRSAETRTFPPGVDVGRDMPIRVSSLQLSGLSTVEPGQDRTMFKLSRSCPEVCPPCSVRKLHGTRHRNKFNVSSSRLFYPRSQMYEFSISIRNLAQAKEARASWSATILRQTSPRFSDRKLRVLP